MSVGDVLDEAFVDQPTAALGDTFAVVAVQGGAVEPDDDLVLTRLGRTPVELKANLDAWLVGLVDALRRA